jgi:3-oxoacyl-[acyl-carrier protein] reductase
VSLAGVQGDRVTILTGAASGIGLRLAQLLVERGAPLVATDVDLSALELRAAEGRWPVGPQGNVLLRRLDVRDAQAWEEAAEAAVVHWGRVDLLLNVAGYLKPGLLHETDVGEVGRHLDVNARGVALGIRAVAPHMVDRRQGHIVNIGSLASLAPVRGLGLYSASKYAVRCLSLVAAQELRPHGVAVTVVCPDAVQTPMLDLQLDYTEAALTFSGPRVLTPDDVAQAVLGPVLRRRPLECWLPASRGWLARAADVLPRLSGAVGGLLERRGRARQQRHARGG